MEDFFTSLKLTAEQRKRAEESIMSLPDIDTKLEALYVLKTKAKRVPIVLLELKQMSKQKSVFESPSLKDVREKTESLYENKMDVTYILVKDGTYVCSHCKSTAVWFRSKQERSGDEGETTRFICANTACGKKWTGS